LHLSQLKISHFMKHSFLPWKRLC